MCAVYTVCWGRNKWKSCIIFHYLVIMGFCNMPALSCCGAHCNVSFIFTYFSLNVLWLIMQILLNFFVANSNPSVLYYSSQQNIFPNLKKKDSCCDQNLDLRIILWKPAVVIIQEITIRISHKKCINYNVKKSTNT